MSIKVLLFGLVGLFLTIMFVLSLTIGIDFQWLRVLSFVGILYVIGVLKYLNNVKILGVVILVWVSLIYQLSEERLRGLIVTLFGLEEWTLLSLWSKLQIWLYFSHAPLLPLLMFLGIVKTTPTPRHINKKQDAS